MLSESKPLFPNFIQARRVLPVWCWHLLRVASVSLTAAFIWLCWHQPELALKLFWGITVPVLPIIFWLVPGLWRNLCPLAALNQIPRLSGLSMGLDLPDTVRRYAGVIGIFLLFTAIPLRVLFLNNDAYAVSLLVLAVLVFALLGGFIFKGKSGWCGSICPLLPVQRLYGQTPSITLPNSHCQPCLGCTQNCYDFNPHVAYLADLYDADQILGNDRKFFAGLMPGLILAYFTLPNADELLWWELYLQFGFYCLMGVGSYHVLETLLKISAQKITAFYAMISINLFYWFASPVIINTTEELLKLQSPEWLVWSVRTAILLVSIDWLKRTCNKEALFLAQAFTSNATQVASNKPIKNHIKNQTDNPVVTIQPGGIQLVTEHKSTLLDLLEANGEKINSGCRMGACGADPVAIIEGEECLSQICGDEQSTLERLGFSNGVRMACCAQINGDISINLDPSSSAASNEAKADFTIDTKVQTVVIIGNGIAGVTAADYIRRYNKDCRIVLIGQEKYPLYNRMAISKLIYSHGGMQGLMLLPDNWYEERNIECWLNTRVRELDKKEKTITLATSELINFDRLIITTGSQAFIPKINQFGLAGCYSLRDADDAMSIRDYIQASDCRFAVVSGGGLLGLEAAYALSKMNMKVTVLERSEHLLRRQLDKKSAEILHEYLQALGLNILYEEEVLGVIGSAEKNNELSVRENHLTQLELKNKGKISADLLIVAAGISPNIRLAGMAGLETNKAIVVDETLRTSDINIYAAGDAAEINVDRGAVYGLWTVAVEQARIAALNAIGANETYQLHAIPTSLKVVGVELTSTGKFNGADSDEEIIFFDAQTYRKIVLHEDVIVGAILLGYTMYAQGIQQAIYDKKNMSAFISQLREGDWSVFEAEAN